MPVGSIRVNSSTYERHGPYQSLPMLFVSISDELIRGGRRDANTRSFFHLFLSDWLELVANKANSPVVSV